MALSIRTRLTLWYGVLLAAALVAFALLSYAELRHALFAAADAELRSGVAETRRIMTAGGSLDNRILQTQLLEHDVDLIQVTSEGGTLLYESGAARTLALPPPSRDSGFESFQAGGIPLRGLSAPFLMGGRRYRLRYLIPMRQPYAAIERFRILTLVSIPAVLLLAIGGGVWMSSRALRPVGRIIRETRAISDRSLHHRLAVPASRDEVRALAETLNEMLERLERSFRRVTDFTADASHELRTPVSIMRTTAEISLRHPRSEDEYRETITSIHCEAERTSSILENLLLLTRSDAGERQQLESLELTIPLGEAVAWGKALAEAKGVEIVTSLSAPPLPIRGDGESLRRLFVIVLDNAVKYTDAGGRVSVVTAVERAEVRVTIADTGIGIEAEDLPRIFDRFYRADRSRSRASGGTGLGLSIARRIVEMHGGSISATSRAGAGSEFQVTLPLAANHDDLAARAVASGTVL